MEKELNPVAEYIEQFCSENIVGDVDVDLNFSTEDMDDILNALPFPNIEILDCLPKEDDWKNNSNSTAKIIDTNNEDEIEQTQPQQKKIKLKSDKEPIPVDKKRRETKTKTKKDKKLKPIPNEQPIPTEEPNLIEMESVPKKFQSTRVDSVIYLSCCPEFNQKGYRLEDVALHIVKGL